MKTTHIGPASLYRFLSHCNDSPLEKVILDCGAGGSRPPLAMFYENGYKTHGIEISETNLKKALRFCRDNNMELGIVLGDMRELPFASESISFVYSYATICHMSREDAGHAIKEIWRVLKQSGLCYVTFCVFDDRTSSEEDKRPGPGEYPYEDEGERGIHTLYDDTEPDRFFDDFKLLHRVRRRIENFTGEERDAWAEIEYIARKELVSWSSE